MIQRYLNARWLLIGLLCYAVLGAATITPGIGWGDDWAQYVLHAKNLLSGRVYSDTGYLFNADVANVGPPAYPPGLPLILMPVLAAFGLNLVALKAACFACVVLSLPWMFLVLERDFGRVVAIVSVILFAFHDQVFALRDAVSSEAPYLLFTMMTLWFAGRDRTDASSPAPSVIVAGAGLGVLAFAAMACRSIGVSVFLAVVLFGIARRKSLLWLSSVITSFVALVWLQKIYIVMPATYAGELTAPSVGLLLGNLRGYWVSLGEIFRVPFGLSLVAATVVIVLALCGVAIVVCRKQPNTPTPPRFGAWAARIPVSVFYLGIYLGGLQLAAIAPQARYLWPVLAIVLALSATPVAALLGRLRNPKFAYAVLLVVLAIYYTALHVTSPKESAYAKATCVPCMELYAFVRANSKPDAVVAFAKPRAMALLAGRPSWVWSAKYSPEEFVAKARSAHVELLVIGKPGSPWAERNPKMQGQSAQYWADLGKTVFQNDMFVAINFAEHPVPVDP